MAQARPTTHRGTVDDAEIAHFSAMAEEWWDARGKFAPLHRMNPCRIGYLREQIVRHFGRDDARAAALDGLNLVDIGCGGGLICEPMARLGATVTGIDASAKNIGIAQTHAAQSGVSVDYRATTAEALAHDGAQFDVVLALEIVEHVADTNLFYDALTALIKPGGLLILSTLNRTPKSYALAIIGAEYVLRWLPRGTHHWSKFIKPSEMARDLTRRGLTLVDKTGITMHPLTWKFAIDSSDMNVNYLMVAKK
ncbi:MAG: bifunctional 2-polyprenyl-6-hydroxyphenol methylase/3-demethylubiquinol 3-O-methyltransferase UbiG [Rickettsiales bacterium]